MAQQPPHVPHHGPVLLSLGESQLWTPSLGTSGLGLELEDLLLEDLDLLLQLDGVDLLLHQIHAGGVRPSGRPSRWPAS